MLIIQKLHFCHWQLMILKCEMQASRCQQSAPDKDGIIAILKHPAIYFNEAKNILQTIMERSFCALFWWTFSFYEVFLRVVHPYLSRPTLTSTFQLYHGPIMLKSGQSCATLICSCRKNVRSPSTHRAHQWNIRKSNFVQKSGHESSSPEKRVLRNFGPVLCSVQCVCINKPSNMDWCSEETSVRTKIMVTIK